jgi:hypothetical protein
VRGNPERKQWLEERGFRFETKDSPRLEDDSRWEFSVLPALAAYRNVHGDLNVPRAFVVSIGGAVAGRVMGAEAGIRNRFHTV